MSACADIEEGGVYKFYMTTEGCLGLWIDGLKALGSSGVGGGVHVGAENATLHEGFHSIRVR